MFVCAAVCAIVNLRGKQKKIIALPFYCVLIHWMLLWCVMLFYFFSIFKRTYGNKKKIVIHKLTQIAVKFSVEDSSAIGFGADWIGRAMWMKVHVTLMKYMRASERVCVKSKLHTLTDNHLAFEWCDFYSINTHCHHMRQRKENK